MKVIAGNRRSGRTTRIIIEAIDTGATIVCANHMMCQHIKEMAKRYGCTVDVMTFDSFVSGRARGLSGPIVIDDLDMCLRTYAGADVTVISVLASETMTLIRDPEFREHLHA